MLMMAMSVFFSILSTGMMSYLAMNTPLGPWVAPVFVVVSMVLIILVFKNKWFYEHAVITISSGSLGGMIGICFGLSFPHFYFLHKDIFMAWLQNPIQLWALIFCLVLVAGLYALFLGHFLRHYFLHRPRSTFPMSQLIHDIIFIDVAKRAHHLMFFGASVGMFCNSLIMAGRSTLAIYISRFQLLPLFFLVGFVTGKAIILPGIVGLVVHLLTLHVFQEQMSSTHSAHSVFITICIGMMVVELLHMLCLAWKNRKSLEVVHHNQYWKKKLKEPFFLKCYALIMIFSFLLLHFFEVSTFVYFYAVIAIAWISKYMIQILSEIGIVPVDTYVWFIILPLIYMIAPTSMITLAVWVFAMLSLGIILDVMFSYKLADLAKVSYPKMVRYQLVSILSAAIFIGIFFIWYCKKWSLDTFQFIAPQADQLNAAISFGFYDYKVLLAGIVCGVAVLTITSELLSVIGVVLMTPYMSLTLIVAGIIAHFVKKRERWYPLWFGVYAGHMLWLMIQVFI